MFYQPIAQSIIASPDLLLKQNESNNNFIKAFNVQFGESLAEEFYESLKQLCKILKKNHLKMILKYKCIFL